MGKYKIGARVRDEDGDEGVIVGKPGKGYRDVRYETGMAAGRVVTRMAKSFFTPIAANDATPEWKPKVGDRVRWSSEDGSFYHKGGEYEILGKTEMFFQLSDGNGSVSHNWTRDGILEKFEPLPVAAEAQGVGGLRIKTGKFYRTRDGRKVGPMRDYGHSTNLSGFVAGDDRVRCFNPDGTHEFGETNIDLIAEWVDEHSVGPVAVAPATATPAGKFKVGDRVRVKGTDTCVTVHGFDRGLYTLRYDTGLAGGPIWFDYELEPAPTPPAPAPKLKKGDLVTLSRSAMITGFDPRNRDFAHVVLGTGGTYTLPVAALVPAS